MSLLWPKPVHIGLFPGHAWAMRGKVELATWGGLNADELLAGIPAALSPLARTGKRIFPQRVRVQVSDAFAAIVAVPWQATLSDDEEWRAYALACFQAAGRTIDGDWHMHVEFRQPGCTGLAYALKRDWLGKLMAIVDESGCSLDVVLPVAACVFNDRSAVLLDAPHRFVLDELHQLSLFAFDREGLISYDVEPAIGGSGAALARLLARQGSDGEAGYWTPAGTEAPDMPGISKVALPGRHWSRAL